MPQVWRLWPLIEAGLQDHDAGVRRATCMAVGCLCEWVEDECISKHAALVPAIMALVADPATQRHACPALGALLEILQDVIEGYLALLMERLSDLLDTALLKVRPLSRVRSTAHASRGDFLPYFAPTMDKLKHFHVLSGEGEETMLRGIAMDAVGTFAEAVEKGGIPPVLRRDDHAGLRRHQDDCKSAASSSSA